MLGSLTINFVNKKIKCVNKNSNLYRVGILSMIALMVHNFPEGIATFMTTYKDIYLGIHLSFAIMMHNIPEGISIAIPIYYSTRSKKRAITNTLLSGLAEPLGAILAFVLFKNFINDITISIVLIFVAGIMITLSINEMLPEVLKYKKISILYLV
jgi:ZIP family zinc transporter